MDNGPEMASNSRMYKVKSPCLQCSYFTTCLWISVFLVALLMYRKWQPNCKDHENFGKIVNQHDYAVIHHSDVEGNDLMHVQSSSIEMVKQVCDTFDECSGFNSNGWLKSSVSNYQPGQADLYIKQLDYKNTKNVKSDYAVDHAEMSASLKIYIYETKIGIDHHPHRVSGYAVERIFADRLDKSTFRTRDPEIATMFFIPIRCSSYILDFPTEHEGIVEAKRITAEILSEIQKKYPYWVRSNGADHFYICSHDIGAQIGEEYMKNSIALVNTADYSDPYFVPHKDISVPPSPSSGLSNIHSIGRGGANVRSSRSILAFFAGDMTSGRIRPLAWKTWHSDPDIEIINHALASATYIEKLKKSKFCLIFRGRESWSPRLMEAIFMGCVPVIISDHYHLPLQGLVDWGKMSVILPESQISKLKSVLQHVSANQLYGMQEYIKSVYSHFAWSNPAQPNDAFHSIMIQLWRRRHVTKYRVL